MRTMRIGDYIKQKRLDAGMSQAQLCAGICEASTLSRIESNSQMPSRNTAMALFQRLGLSHDLYFALVSNHETEISTLKDEITADSIRYRRAAAGDRPQIRAKALENLAKLESIADENDKTIQQYILGRRAYLGTVERPYSFEEQLDLLMKAVRLTAPRFDLNKIYLGLYSMGETQIINQIAILYSDAGKNREAANIYRQLLNYIEEHFHDLSEYGRHFCLVAQNYAIELNIVKRYDEATELANRGWNTCIEYGHYQFLGSFVSILAECYFLKGDIDTSRELYIEAYCFYKITKDEANLAYIQREMKAHLGINPPV